MQSENNFDEIEWTEPACRFIGAVNGLRCLQVETDRPSFDDTEHLPIRCRWRSGFGRRGDRFGGLPRRRRLLRRWRRRWRRWRYDAEMTGGVKVAPMDPNHAAGEASESARETAVSGYGSDEHVASARRTQDGRKTDARRRKPEETEAIQRWIDSIYTQS